jgi:hypothetical protein
MESHDQRICPGFPSLTTLSTKLAQEEQFEPHIGMHPLWTKMTGDRPPIRSIRAYNQGFSLERRSQGDFCNPR